jgi:hypothetical protein
MKSRYVTIISSVNDIKDRIIYDWMTAKETERVYQKETNLYVGKGYGLSKEDEFYWKYRSRAETASTCMYISIGRQAACRTLWDTIKFSEKVSPPEPQSPEDFDFSHIKEEDIPFNNEGE